MAGIFPVTPDGAKQTNCWKLLLILGFIGHIISFLSIIGIYQVEYTVMSNDSIDHPSSTTTTPKRTLNNVVVNNNQYDLPHEIIHKAKYNIRYEIHKSINRFVNSESLWVRLLEQIFWFSVFIIYMYHTHHTKFTVNNDQIEISMGPWSWGKKIMCMPGWIASSQVKKHEIVSINRKLRDSCIDVVFRCYCLPVNWCCCHKSYNSYAWPFCCVCCAQGECCGLCKGDSQTHHMLQINLTQNPCEFHTMWFKRCAPCGYLAVYTCCVYNKIAFSVKDETWVESLTMHGYPLTVGNDYMYAKNNNNHHVTESV